MWILRGVINKLKMFQELHGLVISSILLFVNNVSNGLMLNAIPKCDGYQKSPARSVGDY